jgi:hypothetical protein
MADNPRDRIPGSLSMGPSNRPMHAHGYNPVPGPGRHRARRHFARQEATGFLLLVLVSIGSAWFVGHLLGMW